MSNLYLWIPLFLFGSIALFFIFNRLFKSTNCYKNQFIDFEKFLTNIPKEIDVVNLGSNHPKFGFDYSDINIKGMNWSIGPQTLENDFNVLRQFHHFIKNDGIVIIPICVFKMFLYRYKNYFANTKYYKILDNELMVDFSLKDYKREIKYPLLYHPKRIKYLIKDTPKDTRLELNKNPMEQSQLEQDALLWIRVWEKEFGIDMNNLKLSDENRNCIKKNINILHQMLHFCVEHNYKPVIMLLPLTNELGSKFSDTFVNEHILSYINEANDIQAPIFNYMRDSRFSDSDLYINSFFFNTKGRTTFTKIVAEDLGLLK